MGFTYYQGKEYQKSAKIFESILKNIGPSTKKNEYQYYLSLSKTLAHFWKSFQENDFQKSLEHLRIAEKIDGEFDLDRVYDYFAITHYKLKDLPKTEFYWKRAIEENPSFYGYYQNLGNLLFDQKKFKEAVENYLLTLELGQPNAKVSTLLGLSYIYLNQIDLAKKEFQTSLLIQPKNEIAQNALTQIGKIEAQHQDANNN